MFKSDLYRKDEVWNNIGAKMIQEYGSKIGIKTSYQELFDSLSEDEFNNEDVFNYYEKEIVDVAKAWMFLKERISYYANYPKSNNDEIYDLLLDDFLKIYDILSTNLDDKKKLYESTAIDRDFIYITKAMIIRIWNHNAVFETIIEDLAIWNVRILANGFLGSIESIYTILIINGILILKDIPPLHLTEKDEEIQAISKLLNTVVSEAKIMPVKQWANNSNFKSYLKTLISNAEYFFESTSF
ncbi:hypothetical protein SHELI_v1c06720 [Spiroplasma helicoides]|uniref:Uncharacterized protein n=1 Tax=Spiroplasma helicoides TaxID=216938 RepID=A0A1B3SL27_9MOLU|nr:hypothetical protein [Spiroplasma helicoides]AOG60623.1 hypothetical protein SHELI_v1c06720 [Spiroplasma helicoides]